jgi:hypothetical protein
MKTAKATLRRKAKTKPSHLTRSFMLSRKYRNHKRYVHPDLL